MKTYQNPYPTPPKELLPFAVAAALVLLAAPFAGAQEPVTQFDDIFVSASRLGVGLAGASTSVIGADEIKRSPAQSLPELLGLEAGIQSRDFFGGTAGTRATVDIRGFGTVGTQNTLLLIDGRRLNDIDLAAIDWSKIPKDSIERIEIIRGNAGAVLYGDGAVGGVINIVTKPATEREQKGRLNVTFGSDAHRGSDLSLNQSAGPVSVSLYANYINAHGYRDNNDFIKRNFSTEFRHRGKKGDAFIKLNMDDENLQMPGARLITESTGSDLLETARRGAATPFDFALQKGFDVTLGATRQLSKDMKLAVEGGVRQKDQDAYLNAFSIVDTVLTTWSLTPRLIADHGIGGLEATTTLGLDYYYADYDSDRKSGFAAIQPDDRYNAKQQSVALYAQTRLALSEDTEAQIGLRVQRIDANAGHTKLPGTWTTQIDSLNDTEWHYAANLGIDHQLTDDLALFGRLGRSLRIPTIDERIGSLGTGSFELNTQTSKDVEAGMRYAFGPFSLQSSAFLMELKNEIAFDSQVVNFGTNKNYKPTRRYGVENSLDWRIADDLRLKSAFSYMRAEFMDGDFDGNDIPLVAPWTVSATMFWDIWGDYLKLAATVNYLDSKRLENDERNVFTKIPSHTLVDIKLNGAYRSMAWAAEVNNILDKDYYNYGIASATTMGTYNAYPLPGRTFKLTAGAEF